MKALLHVSVASCLCLLLLMPISGCVTTEGGEKFNILSTQEEVALGDKVAAEIEKKEKILNDPGIQAYVQEMGARIAKQSPRTDVPYKFTVIDNPKTVNAFALPGGHMYIYTGLMKLCSNEAELASVMGHEIAHVAAHHHGESMTRQYGYSFIASLILGDSPSANAELMAQIMATLGESKFSRTQENEADRMGMDFLWRAGYKPDAMVSFMEKMGATEKQGGGAGVLKFISSHPPTPERIAALQALEQQYPADIRAKSPVYAERYQEKVLKRLK
ncbi:MAG: M48 family metallopeptidase [Candidatus Hydrogenedentales bacterium]